MQLPPARGGTESAASSRLEAAAAQWRRAPPAVPPLSRPAQPRWPGGPKERGSWSSSPAWQPSLQGRSPPPHADAPSALIAGRPRRPQHNLRPPTALLSRPIPSTAPGPAPAHPPATAKQAPARRCARLAPAPQRGRASTWGRAGAAGNAGRGRGALQCWDLGEGCSGGHSPGPVWLNCPPAAGAAPCCRCGGRGGLAKIRTGGLPPPPCALSAGLPSSAAAASTLTSPSSHTPNYCCCPKAGVDRHPAALSDHRGPPPPPPTTAVLAVLASMLSARHAAVALACILATCLLASGAPITPCPLWLGG